MKFSPSCALSLLAALGSAHSVRATPVVSDFGFTLNNGVYSTIASPGSDTFATGINDAGQVVGSASGSGGFLYTAGSFTPLPFLLYPLGINDAGQIVGKVNYSGFLDSGGTVTTIDVYPGADTWANGINNLGEIVGYDTFDGFFDVSGVITILDVPGAVETEILGINDAGDMVGTFRLAGGHYQPFLYRNGVFTTLVLPGSPIGDAYAAGIDDAGDILIGLSNSNRSQAFLDVNGVFTSIGPPNAASVIPGGISSSGLIVGTYTTPEPGTLLLFACGLGALICFGWLRGLFCR